MFSCCNILHFRLQRYNKYLEYTRILAEKVNLFVFLAKRHGYSHKRANVLSGECQRQAASEGTTNIWNMQVIPQEMHLFSADFT